MFVIKDDSDGNIYPADRCVFRSRVHPTERNAYQITNASFYPGNAAAVTIDSPILGYMGKSGRFVATTEA